MADNSKQSFVLYHDVRKPMELLTDEQRGRLFMAILDYSEYGTVQDFHDGAVDMAFAFIRSSIDRDTAVWEAKRAKRAEAGRKGGEQTQANRANQANATFAEQNEQTQANQAVPVPVPAPVPVPVKEKETDKPPCPPPLPDTSFGPELQSAFERWLSYKKERREGYKPTGLNALVTQIKNNAATYGEHDVIQLIETSMASGWKGIAFDRLKQGNRPQAADNRNRLRTDSDYQSSDDFFGGG